jgi:hypothetical protein
MTTAAGKGILAAYKNFPCTNNTPFASLPYTLGGLRVKNIQVGELPPKAA